MVAEPLILQEKKRLKAVKGFQQTSTRRNATKKINLHVSCLIYASAKYKKEKYLLGFIMNYLF